MTEVQHLIDRVADTDVTVLIRGESGTGKELVARALCAGSRRRHKPFVKLNCAALPSELLESELFGVERGAFTGAVDSKPGKFESADGGTMFLDEIGDMSFGLQAKLLQVLQDGEFSRVGGKRDVHVDVRLVAATNKDLEQAIEDGEFRSDLFFRLNVVSINLPPLRERRDEVPTLSEYFLRKYSAHYARPSAEFSADTKQLLMDYDWPGNIRELENLIKRTVVLGGEAPIRKELIRGMAMAAERRQTMVNTRQPPSPVAPAAVADAASAAIVHRRRATDVMRPPNGEHPRTPRSHSLKDVSRRAARASERDLIAQMLEDTRWNRKKTATLLGISYKALLYKIKESGLDKIEA